MSLDRFDFDAISDTDIGGLVASSVAESSRLEFKRQPYGVSDGDRREFLKDVTAFANAAGGHLVIGIDAKDGIASDVIPLPLTVGGSEIDRMENLLRDGVEPRISGVRIRGVPVVGGLVLVLRVPRSWNQPHRVSHGRANRFYIRNSGGVHETSVEELRRLFAGGSTMMERIRGLRRERRHLVAQGEGPILMEEGGSRLLLHLIPLAALSESLAIEISAAQQLQCEFSPLGAKSFGSRFNFEGFLVHRHGDACHGYTQIFRTGMVEATKGRIVVQREGAIRVIPARKFCDDLMVCLPKYLDGLRKLDIPPPIVVMLSLEGIRGSILVTNNDWALKSEEISADTLELPPVVIEDYGSSAGYQRAMRPIFDALWNAGGHARCNYFTVDGAWN